MQISVEADLELRARIARERVPTRTCGSRSYCMLPDHHDRTQSDRRLILQLLNS
jgi:hypothetical protein